MQRDEFNYHVRLMSVYARQHEELNTNYRSLSHCDAFEVSFPLIGKGIQINSCHTDEHIKKQMDIFYGWIEYLTGVALP